MPTFSHRGGVTAPSSQPSVTQLNAENSVAAPWPHSVDLDAHATTNKGTAKNDSHHRPPWAAHPRAMAANSGTATSASHVNPVAVPDMKRMAKITPMIDPIGIRAHAGPDSRRIHGISGGRRGAATTPACTASITASDGIKASAIPLEGTQRAPFLAKGLQRSCGA